MSAIRRWISWADSCSTTAQMVHLLPPGSFTVAERYNPRRRRWQRLPDMSKARGGIAAARVGDRIAVFGGEESADDIVMAAARCQQRQRRPHPEAVPPCKGFADKNRGRIQEQAQRVPVDVLTGDDAVFADVAIEHDMAILSAVGDGLRADARLGVRLLATLEGFPLRMVSQGASRRNVTVVLHDRDVAAAMARVHAAWFENAECLSA